MDYAREVLADSPFGWWRFDDTNATLLDASGNGRNGAYVNSPTQSQAGALNSDSNTATKFNGTNQYATIALDLSALSVITVEFWLFWTAFAADNKIAMEFAPAVGATTGGFQINPDQAANSSTFLMADAASHFWDDGISPPTANVWHHYVWVADRATPANTVYVDGVSRSLTTVLHNAATYGNFGNATLFLMSKDGSTFFSPANSLMDELAIYSGALSAQRVLAHYRAGIYNDRTRPLAMAQAVNRAGNY